MRRFSSLNNLSNALALSLDRLGLGGKLREKLAIVKWREVVGDTIADVSIPARITDGVLWVACKSSVWANELMLHREHIKTNLNKCIGKRVVKEIRFSSKGYRALKTSQTTENTVEKLDVEGIVLSAEQQRQAEQVASKAEEPKLAEAIRKAVATSLKRELAKTKGEQNLTK